MRLTGEYFAIPLYSLWYPCSTIRIHHKIDFCTYINNAGMNCCKPSSLLRSIDLPETITALHLFHLQVYTKDETNKCLPPNTKQSH